MKKNFVIFIGLMLIVPIYARGENAATQYVAPTTAQTQGSAIVSANAPKYDLNTITTDDQEHIASTAYVKGAHNSALSAINYLSDNKQALLTNSNVTEYGTGAVVTGVSAASGVVTVTKNEVQIPVGGASGNNVSSHASIWLQ